MPRAKRCRPLAPVGTDPRKVEMVEFEKNDVNLNISRCICTAVKKTEINLVETHRELVEIEKALAVAKDKHNAFLKELDLKPLS